MSVIEQVHELPAGGDEAEPRQPGLLKRIANLELTPQKVKSKDLMHFSRQLAVFVQAGIPILDALETIREETGNKFFAVILADMIDELRRGSTLSAAAAKHATAFPAYYIGILGSAELTGTLDVVLLQLADYIERDIEARQKVTSALVYPAVIVAMSIVTVIILTSYVLPKFQHFFEDLDAKLPLATRMLLGVAKFFENWWFVLVALVGLAFVAIVVSIQTERGRAIRDKLTLKIPVVGDLVRFALMERFCRILSAMSTAGVPLDQALTVAATATNNAVYREGLREAREGMLRGEGLAAPLAATELFPSAARQMIRVGEDTGTLDHQMETAAKYFDRELDYKLKRFTSLFEPAVLLIVGLIVGFVAIALVSAMYGIFNQVKP